MELASEQINELAAALAKAQGEITSAIEDKTNPHFKTSYASLNSVWEACREPLSKNGLAVVQIMTGSNDQLILITTLAHSSGQWMKSVLPVTSAKATPQALGSAITYMRRYSLAALVGVAPNEDDDDAEEAEQPSYDKRKESKPIHFKAPQNSAVPPVVQTQEQKATKPEIPKEKAPGYDEFVTKHQITNGKMKWVQKIAQETNRTEIQTINAAMMNEASFVKAYNMYVEQEKTKLQQQVRHMDELVEQTA